MTRSQTLMILVCLTLAMTACNLRGAATGGPRAWIDAPLDGSQIALAPYEVVFHGSDPSGVALMELSVNGQILANLTNPDPAQLLVTIRQTWEPAAPGTYTLEARTQNTAGVWSEADHATITIGEPTPTASPTPAQTLTPTPSATIPVVAISNLRVSTYTFYRADKTPREVLFTIHISYPAGVSAVQMVFRLCDPNARGRCTQEWNYEALSPIGNGDYTYTLDARYPAFLESYPQTLHLYYQFLAVHLDASVTSSPIYSDIILQGP